MINGLMKTALLTLLLLFSISSRVIAGILAGPTTNPANGHQYYLLTAQNWSAAEAEAKSLGGHLATINDAAENAWIFSTFASFGSVNRILLIGLNDAEIEGTFAWASGETSTYRNWNAGEPNNFTPTLNQDYATMRAPNATNPGQWNDVALSESGTYHGVVEVLPTSEIAFPTIQPAVELSWPTQTTKQYQLQWSPTLGPTAQWTNLGPQFTGTGSTYHHLASTRNTTQRYYRIVIISP